MVRMIMMGGVRQIPRFRKLNPMDYAQIRRYVDAIIATGDGSTGSSFMLFQGFEGIGHTPYRPSQSNITVAAEECGTVEANRNWVMRVGRKRCKFWTIETVQPYIR